MNKTKNWADSLGVALVSNESTRPIATMEILREVLDYAFARPARRAAKKAELAKKYKNLK